MSNDDSSVIVQEELRCDEQDARAGSAMPTMTSTNAANMAACVSLPLARRYHPSISSSQLQSPTPCATTISSMDTRKSTYGSSDSNATATPPMKASPPAPADLCSRMELVADALGSKRSRSEERRPRTMASSAVTVSAPSPPAADASDAVERLSEQSCRAEEAVKEDSAESRKMEAMVLVPGGGGAAWKDCVLGFLQDGQTQGGAVAGAGGGGGGEARRPWPCCGRESSRPAFRLPLLWVSR
uniref:Uncharacterized protein n=1 Tax=Oryza brachyantha TaxID=4533 RepID=J3L641_ORYBR